MSRRAVAVIGVATVAFVATSTVTLWAVTVVGDGQLAPALEPLRPADVPPLESAPARPTSRRDVVIAFPDGQRGATLIAPADGQPRAGLVLVAGAGPATREALLPLAHRFAAAGVAALTYDKRTEGYGPLHRDYAALGADAGVAARTLREATGLRRVGGLGLSEGSWALVSAAAQPGSPFDALVLAAAPVVSPLEQASWVVDRRLQRAPGFVRRMAGTAVAQGSTFLEYLDFDTAPLLPRISVPVFAVWGASDSAVPVNAAYRELEAGLSAPSTALIAPGAGHDLQQEPDGWLPRVAAWAGDPSGAGLSGAEPETRQGIAVLPRPRWFAHPALHLGLSVAAAVTAGAYARRRHTRRMEGTLEWTKDS